MIELDGSEGEGGGQVLRTSLTLSLLTGKPFRLRNIRARRTRPGLQPQHLMCVKAAQEIGGATVRGASKGSSDLNFEPGPMRSGKYCFVIGTAGSTSLVLHTVYLPLALRGHEPSEVAIEGGTHNEHAPCFHFLDATWSAYLDLLGVRVKVEMEQPGFYPRGGGRIVADIQPCAQVAPLVLDTVAVENQVTGVSATAGLPEDIGRRMARRAQQGLKDAGARVTIAQASWDNGPGVVLMLTVAARPVPALFFALGERGKRAEAVADEAVDEATAFMNADIPGIDPYSADQIVLPLALAAGPSRFPVSKVTQHLLTNLEVARNFLDRNLRCSGVVGEPGIVEID